MHTVYRLVITTFSDPILMVLDRRTYFVLELQKLSGVNEKRSCSYFQQKVCQYFIFYLFIFFDVCEKNRKPLNDISGHLEGDFYSTV